MAKNVYVIIAHDTRYKSTYISQVCSNKKKAEDFKVYIERVMKDEPIVYWVSKERVF